MATELTFTNYNSLWDYRTTDYKIKNAGTAFAGSNLPGVAIMKSLQALLRPGDTTDMKVEGLFRVYVEYSRSHNWKWSGGGACGTPKILDAVQPPLECQAFAVGLMMLMIAKPPFGLGIPIADVDRPTFVGDLVKANKVGFVAHHPSDGVLDLPPNVHALKVDTLTPGYYVWANHKVVSYGGKFFDPSYGCQYAKLADMVYLKIDDFGIQGEENVDYKAWESRASTDEEGKCYLKCSSQNKTYYFKVHPATTRSVAGKLEYDGPFTAL
ncbi:MAG TPA: hypothetical protein VG096_11375 [Bryobacteraceae bacterium]|nr:hypothetical protein [Bryobacteraceae bacterium]